MTYEEAQAELTLLRGLAGNTQALATFRERTAALYWAVCRKTLPSCNCRDKWTDALVEIYRKLQQIKATDTMEQLNTKAQLVRGVVLFWKGNHYTNANLTDEVAREFLAAFPQRSSWFAVKPEETPAEAVTEAVEATKPAEQPATPSKKKSAKKRK
jgi:flagellar motility protein MotE (MotC chaperone)